MRLNSFKNNSIFKSSNYQIIKLKPYGIYL